MNFTELQNKVKNIIENQHNLFPNKNLYKFVSAREMSIHYNIVTHFIIYATWFTNNDVEKIVNTILNEYVPVEEYRRA